ncbi:MAG: hypothetical protein KDC43_25180 [Saprospiraceae bacterium]|nr:hypothetical protein [Saprospiraceae bacterium]
MASSKKKWSLAALIGAGALFLLLVLFPAGSWFYLQRGLNYRLAALEELKDLGRLPADLAFVNQSGSIIDTAFLQGKVLIAGVLSGDRQQDQPIVDRLRKLHEQFDQRDDVLFLSHLPEREPAALLAEAEALGIRDTAQWMLLATPEGQLESLRAAYHLQDPSEVCLIDTTLMVRKVYRTSENADMGRLVEHIALIMPFVAERELIFKREKEK